MKISISSNKQKYLFTINKTKAGTKIYKLISNRHLNIKQDIISININTKCMVVIGLKFNFNLTWSTVLTVLRSHQIDETANFGLVQQII